MNDHTEPERLFESADAPPQLRSLLARAHEDVPSPAERDLLIKAAMGRGTGAWGSMSGHAGSVRWAARLARHSTKILSIAAVVGVGAGTLYVVGLRDRPPERRSPPTGVVLPAVEENQAATVAAEPGEAPGGVEEPGSGGSVTAENAAVVAPRATAPVRPAMPSHPRRGGAWAKAANDGRVRSRHSEPASTQSQRVVPPPPVAPEREGPSAPEAGPAPPQDRSAEATAVARAEPARPEDDPRASESGTEEATLLRSARQALARAPERTLSLTEDHLRLFPRGILDQEREALAIEALIKLGRIDQARTRAHDFERTYRDSPHRARIERAFRRVPGGFAPP